MKVLLRIDDIYFLDRQPTWWRDSGRLRPVLEALEGTGLWRELGYYGREGGKRHKLHSLEALLEASATFRAGTYDLVDRYLGSPSVRLSLGFQTGALKLHLVLDPAFVRQYRGDLLSHLIDVVCRIHDGLSAGALMGPLVNVEIIGTVYPRVRPPQFHLRFVFGTIVNIVSRSFHRQHEMGAPEEVARMLAAPVPADAQRLDRGDLVIFRWAEDVRDEGYLAQRRSCQEQWLVNAIDPPRDDSYNAAGDYRIFLIGATGPADPLTWYDSGRKLGYKAAVVFPDGSVDAELFAEMTNWIQSRRLPDGRGLEGLFLVAQSRAAALTIHPRAAGIGIKAVYYPDNSGQLWDPFPPGPWI